MVLKSVMWNVLLVTAVLLCSWASSGMAYVSYENRAIVINGRRRIPISGSIHYPRSTPKKAKDGGLDVIQTYVFWNGHEPKQGKYYFEERYDLVKFIKLIRAAGLYAHLIIGPYACAEWNFGGFPVWLKYAPGISFRTDNDPFKFGWRWFDIAIATFEAPSLVEVERAICDIKTSNWFQLSVGSSSGSVTKTILLRMVISVATDKAVWEAIIANKEVSAFVNSVTRFFSIGEGKAKGNGKERGLGMMIFEWVKAKGIGKAFNLFLDKIYIPSNNNKNQKRHPQRTTKTRNSILKDLLILYLASFSS